MKKIKIFEAFTSRSLQTAIDEWIQEDSPEIISCAFTNTRNDNRCIAIIYEDKKEIKI
jgi:hypothetical protein